MSEPQHDRPRQRYRSHVHRCSPEMISGYAYDLRDPGARLVVELLVDGVPVALARAEHFSDALRRAGRADARHGFAFALAPEWLRGAAFAQVAVANRGRALGPPIDLSAPGPGTGRDEGAGGVRWRGGLELTGWLACTAEGRTPRVRLSVEGLALPNAFADRWAHRPSAGGTSPVHAFSAHLPSSLADGATKRITVTDEAGAELRGSPVSLVAFPDPLADLVARIHGPDAGALGERARLLDRQAPRARSFHDRDAWPAIEPRAGGPTPPAARAAVAVAFMGKHPDRLAASFEGLRADPEWDGIAAALPSPDGVGFAPGDLAAFLGAEASGAEVLVLAPAGTVFAPGAPARLAAAVAGGACLAYGDVALGPPGSEAFIAFPSFDYERWLEQGYGALAFAVPAAVGRRGGAASLYHLACAAFGGARPRDVVHLPGLTARLHAPDPDAAAWHLATASRAHLAARGLACRTGVGAGSLVRPGSSLPSVRIARALPRESVSVVVAVRDARARDRAERARARLAAVRREAGGASAELIVVDAGPTAPEPPGIHDAWRRDGARVLEVRGHDRARLFNRAVEAAGGQLTLVLDGGVEPSAPGWLDEMLGRAADPTVSAVGAAIAWPSGVVRHAGLVLGPGYAAADALSDRLVGEPGYGDLLCVAHEPSAVGDLCLLVRRAHAVAVRGMDAGYFPLRYGAVDLCLRLGTRAGAVVLTPHLDLRCADPPAWEAPTLAGALARERDLFRARWGGALDADPAYSPLLALGTPYSGLADPPRDRAPRRRVLAPPRPLPHGS